MEININCDLGEKSKFHSIKNDPELLNIVNSANIACGYHAGDEQTMDMVIQISKKNGVSLGAHPSFNDPENFGRKRMNLSSLRNKKTNLSTNMKYYKKLLKNIMKMLLILNHMGLLITWLVKTWN